MDETEINIVDDTNKLKDMDPDADADNKADGMNQVEVLLEQTTNTTTHTESEEVCTGSCLLSMHTNIKQSIADLFKTVHCFFMSMFAPIYCRSWTRQK